MWHKVEVHSRKCDALDDLRIASNNMDCEASVRTRWTESGSTFFHVRSCCHLMETKLARLVMFTVSEALKESVSNEAALGNQTKAKIPATAQRCIVGCRRKLKVEMKFAANMRHF